MGAIGVPPTYGPLSPYTRSFDLPPADAPGSYVPPGYGDPYVPPRPSITYVDRAGVTTFYPDQPSYTAPPITYSVTEGGVTTFREGVYQPSYTPPFPSTGEYNPYTVDPYSGYDDPYASGGEYGY